jgi:hypothetical protein
MSQSVNTGTKELYTFARVAGMSAQEFKQAFQRDAAGALTQFLVGLGKVSKDGNDVFEVLDALGLDSARLRDNMLKALKTIDPTTEDGKAKEQFVLELVRASESLTTAVARIPDEFWFAHMMGEHIGIQEIIEKLKVA